MIDHPTRYFPVHADAIAADEDGTHVLYSDYAALRAEYERAKGELNKLVGQCIQQYGTDGECWIHGNQLDDVDPLKYRYEMLDTWMGVFSTRDSAIAALLGGGE